MWYVGFRDSPREKNDRKARAEKSYGYIDVFARLCAF